MPLDQSAAFFSHCFAPLLGNDSLKRYFIAELEKGTLSHAYILEGPKGSGRRTLAACVLTALAGEGNPFAFKIREGNCPDVTVYGLSEKKKTVGVETVRRLKSEAYIKPNDLDFRCFLLDDAHLLTVSAQNAALKILEEPPKGVYFFLLCENAGLLLPTVRSRAATLRMERFSTEEMEKIFCSEPRFGLQNAMAEAPEAFSLALRRADGSLGAAAEAYRSRLGGAEKQQQKVRESCDALFAALKERDLLRIVPCVLSLPSQREELDRVLEGFLRLLRDLLRIRSVRGTSVGEAVLSGELLYYLTVSDAVKADGALSDRVLLLLRDRCEEARRHLAQNANVACLKTNLGGELYKASRG